MGSFEMAIDNSLYYSKIGHFYFGLTVSHFFLTQKRRFLILGMPKSELLSNSKKAGHIEFHTSRSPLSALAAGGAALWI
jgi:hypothetical protein